MILAQHCYNNPWEVWGSSSTTSFSSSTICCNPNISYHMPDNWQVFIAASSTPCSLCLRLYYANESTPDLEWTFFLAVPDDHKLTAFTFHNNTIINVKRDAYSWTSLVISKSLITCSIDYAQSDPCNVKLNHVHEKCWEKNVHVM